MRLKPGAVKKVFPLAFVLGVLANVPFSILDLTHPPMMIFRTLNFTSLGLGLLLFPGIVSFFAHRRYFLWGFVPGFVFWLVAQTLGLVLPQSYSHPPVMEEIFSVLTGLPMTFVILLACMLITSGPISIVRYSIRLRRARSRLARKRLLAQRTAMEQEMHAVQGVRPPPPEDQGPAQ